MRAINVQGVEVTVDYDFKCPHLFAKDQAFSLVSAGDIKALGDAFRSNSPCVISCLCLHNQFDTRGSDEIVFVDKVVEAAVELKVPCIRLDFVPRKIKDEKQYLRFAIAAGKEIVKNSEGTGIRFGVENHGHVTNKLEFSEPFLDGVGSDRFGLTLDTGNFYWYGYPLSKLYEIYEQFAATACHTHAKSINYPEDKQNAERPTGWEYGKYCCPIYEGDIDFERVGKILRAKKFKGDLCIENESLGRFPKEKHREILRKEADLLHKIAKS
jgi:sugar phosphate isomerase/epimerase